MSDLVQDYFNALAELLAAFGFNPETPVTIEDFRQYFWRVEYCTEKPAFVVGIRIANDNDDNSHCDWLHSFGNVYRGEQSFYSGEQYALFNFRDWLNENANRVAILDNAKRGKDWEGWE